jgi:hypothetical protein
MGSRQIRRVSHCRRLTPSLPEVGSDFAVNRKIGYVRPLWGATVVGLQQELIEVRSTLGQRQNVGSAQIAQRTAVARSSSLVALAG